MKNGTAKIMMPKLKKSIDFHNPLLISTADQKISRINRATPNRPKTQKYFQAKVCTFSIIIIGKTTL